jgi:hypothetical protein
MRSTLALLLAIGASGTVATVCNGVEAAIAVGSQLACPSDEFSNPNAKPCTYQGFAWDINCKPIANTAVGSTFDVDCLSPYNNNFHVTCQQGGSTRGTFQVTNAVNLFGVQYVCHPADETPGSNDCGIQDGGHGNYINACCFALNTSD